MKKRSMIILGALLLGNLLLALGVVVFKFDTIVKIVVDFYTNFSWQAVLSIVIASFVPGFVIGQKIGPFKFKKGNN